MSKLAFNASVILANDRCCMAHVDSAGRILRTNAVTCLWEGQPRFDEWFRANYGEPVEIKRDNGRLFHALTLAQRVQMWSLLLS